MVMFIYVVFFFFPCLCPKAVNIMPVFLPLFPHQLLIHMRTHASAHTHSNPHSSVKMKTHTRSLKCAPSPPIRPPCGSLCSSSPHFLITAPSSTPIYPSQRPDGEFTILKGGGGVYTDSSFSDNVAEMRHCGVHHAFWLNIWHLIDTRCLWIVVYYSTSRNVFVLRSYAPFIWSKIICLILL